MANEQQGGKRGSYGTKKQLILNKTILEHSIKFCRNLSICYIDYQKAYDSVPHPWILETLRTYKINPIIIDFLEHAMSVWEIKLVLRHENGVLEVPNIKIKRGIFQGDTLSPLLFVIAINPLSYLLNKSGQGYSIDKVRFSHMLYMDDIKTFSSNTKDGVKLIKIMFDFSKDIGMSFGIEKCKVLNVVRGKYAKLGGVQLPNGDFIEEMDEGDVYKYLGVVESTMIKHAEMKQKILTTFKKRVKSILKSELNSKNIMIAIGEYAVPVMSYTYGIINWTEEEIKNADLLVRKNLNMYKMFELKSDIDRLYSPRLMGGRGLQSIWDGFKCANVRIAHYMTGSVDHHMKVCANFDRQCLFSIIKRAEKFSTLHNPPTPENIESRPLLRQAKIVAQRLRETIYKDRYELFLAKPQHGALMRIMKENDTDIKTSCSWMDKCHLSPQSEAYICGMQEMAIFTRWHEHHIIRNRDSDLCRICKKEPETTFHILSGCDVLAKKEYFDRHNSVAKYIHYQICKRYGIQTEPKWHLHRPAEVYMDGKVELLWDIPITTARMIGANRPDITRDKSNKVTYIIDISCPCDTDVHSKEVEKISKYCSLRVELAKMWNTECVVIPVIVGGCGTVSKEFTNYLGMIPAELQPEMCLKIALLGSEKIMRSSLSRK